MVGRVTASQIASASAASVLPRLTNHQVLKMRRNAGSGQEIRVFLAWVGGFAPHYFATNLCGRLTSRGIIDVEIRI
jgi:hypothetical protein